MGLLEKAYAHVPLPSRLLASSVATRSVAIGLIESYSGDHLRHVCLSSDATVMGKLLRFSSHGAC